MGSLAKDMWHGLGVFYVFFVSLLETPLCLSSKQNCFKTNKVFLMVSTKIHSEDGDIIRLREPLIRQARIFNLIQTNHSRLLFAMSGTKAATFSV